MFQRLAFRLWNIFFYSLISHIKKVRLPTHYKILTEQANLTYDNKVQLFAKQCAGEKKQAKGGNRKLIFSAYGPEPHPRISPYPRK